MNEKKEYWLIKTLKLINNINKEILVGDYERVKEIKRSENMIVNTVGYKFYLERLEFYVEDFVVFQWNIKKIEIKENNNVKFMWR